MKNVSKGLFLAVLVTLLVQVNVFAYEQYHSKFTNKTINKTKVLEEIAKDDEAILKNPNVEENYLSRAFLNYLLDNIQEAILDYDKLISLNPNNEEYYLNRGYLKHISNMRNEALKDYDLALKVKPDYAFAHNNKGVVLAELGKKEDSLASYDTAIKIDPNYADAYYNRGNLKTQNNKNEEALEDFNTAIKLNPHDSASFNNRGVVKRKLNFNVGALSDFSIAIRLDPEDITALANRGRLKKRYFDSEGAEEDFKTAINSAEASPVLVKQIEMENKIAEAQRPSVSSTTPDHVKFQSAPAEMNKALRMPKVKTTEDIQKIVNKYNVKESQEENIKTAVVKASVVKMEPSNIKPITKTQTTPVNVAPEITTKPVSNPQLAECYYIRALQKYILQNRESALKDFDMAIQHNPNYAEAYYYRAAIKRDFKDEGFVDDYKKAITLDPKLKSVDEANVLMILKK